MSVYGAKIATAPAWRAELSLGFERRADRTVLATRRHDGPLVVQKALYPEGPGVCQAIVVHPPAGIAGGDELVLNAAVGADAAALLTTPGAGKWYRSAGRWAHQQIAFRVASAASLEWLPQETIFFDAARADLGMYVHLTGDARYIGWDVMCFGRTGSGERFARGECRTDTRIYRNGRLQWFERSCLDGGSAAFSSPCVLAGRSVVGTLVAAAPTIPAGALEGCRGIVPAKGEGGVTGLPGLLVARYLGESSEAAKEFFMELWRVLRPAMLGREAQPPRIWRT